MYMRRVSYCIQMYFVAISRYSSCSSRSFSASAGPTASASVDRIFQLFGKTLGSEARDGHEGCDDDLSELSERSMKVVFLCRGLWVCNV